MRPPGFFPVLIGCLLVCLPVRAADWAQLQCDAARTGWTSDSPAPPFQPAYVLEFAPEPVGLVQPVIRRDTMYVPTLHGRLYAIEPLTGKRLWVTEGLGRVCRSAAAGDGRIYVANLEGEVLAVKAGGSGVAWRKDLGFGISASPCLEGGKLFIGTRRGDFFCLDGLDGSVVWQRRLPHYVWSSAAVWDGKVYVGTDGELHVYCLDAAKGDILWESEKIPGMFQRDWCPVIAAGKVFVYTTPAEYYQPPEPKPYEIWGPHKLEPFMKNYEQLRNGELPEEFVEGNQKLVAALEKEPRWQVLHAFDAQTGKRPYVPGAYRLLSGWLSATPPPSVDSNGKLQVPVPYGMSRFGRLDPKTGQICGVIVGPLVKRRESGYPERNPDGLGTNSDENHASSCGGDRVYWIHWATLTNPMAKNIVYNVKTHEVVYMLFSQSEFRKAPRIPISVSTSRAMATGMRQSYDNAGDYTAFAIWRNMLFHQTEGRIMAVRGQQDAKEVVQ